MCKITNRIPHVGDRIREGAHISCFLSFSLSRIASRKLEDVDGAFVTGDTHQGGIPVERDGINGGRIGTSA